MYMKEQVSLKKMLNEIEALLANGYFAFLLNESELRSGIESRTTTTIEGHTSEQ
jgi:hypothetical protein